MSVPLVPMASTLRSLQRCHRPPPHLVHKASTYSKVGLLIDFLVRFPGPIFFFDSLGSRSGSRGKVGLKAKGLAAVCHTLQCRLRPSTVSGALPFRLWDKYSLHYGIRWVTSVPPGDCSDECQQFNTKLENIANACTSTFLHTYSLYTHCKNF